MYFVCSFYKINFLAVFAYFDLAPFVKSSDTRGRRQIGRRARRDNHFVGFEFSFQVPHAGKTLRVVDAAARSKSLAPPFDMQRKVSCFGAFRTHHVNDTRGAARRYRRQPPGGIHFKANKVGTALPKCLHLGQAIIQIIHLRRFLSSPFLH